MKKEYEMWKEESLIHLEKEKSFSSFLLSLNNLPCFPAPATCSFPVLTISHSGELPAASLRAGGITLARESEDSVQKFPASEIQSHLEAQTPPVLAVTL